MKSYFTYIAEVAELLKFVSSEFPAARLAEIRPGYFTINDRDIVVNGAVPEEQQIPSVVLRDNPKADSLELYKALRKKFKKKENDVVLHYLGPDFVF